MRNLHDAHAGVLSPRDLRAVDDYVEDVALLPPTRPNERVERRHVGAVARQVGVGAHEADPQIRRAPALGDLDAEGAPLAPAARVGADERVVVGGVDLRGEPRATRVDRERRAGVRRVPAWT